MNEGEIRGAILIVRKFRWILFALLALVTLAACEGQTSGPETAATQAEPPPAAATATLLPEPTPVQEMQAPALTEAPQATPEQQPTEAETALAVDCTSPAALTPAMTAGPYFMAGSPERSSLREPGVPGTPITITGYVLTSDCQPIANARLDFWQADGEGVYDNAGYKLRGHQFTDANGRYLLETVLPGRYPGRTPHIHVTVQAPDGPALTTQLFFPDEPGNLSDRIFSPELVVTMLEAEGEIQEASFNFILKNR